MKTMLVPLLLTAFALSVNVRGSSYAHSSVTLNPSTGGYDNIEVVISHKLDRKECPKILQNVKVSLDAASRSLYNALAGKAHFSSVNIQVPESWSAADCQTPLHANMPFSSEMGDIYVSEDHPYYQGNPWTQQSQGCGKRGDFIYLPRSFIHRRERSGRRTLESDDDLPEELQHHTTEEPRFDAPSEAEAVQSLKAIGDELRNQWLRYRFGVFADWSEPNTSPPVSSPHHALCYGETINQTVQSHADMLNSQAHYSGNTSISWLTPSFTISQRQAPKYVIVLEDSKAMNVRGHWTLIEKALKKLIRHDLPSSVYVGIVLFNKGAHKAHMLSRLRHDEARNNLIVKIKNKWSLSPFNDSCVRCGVNEAIAMLSMFSMSDPGSTRGGNVIIISQGKSQSLGIEEEQQLQDMADKYLLKIFSLAIPRQPQDDLSLSLERLCHGTGGRSFYIPDDSYAPVASLTTYVAFVDALREIQARTTRDGPKLIHAKSFLHHNENGALQEQGSFIIDKYIGRDTRFDVFASQREYGFLKAITVRDNNGNQAKDAIEDSLQPYNIYSVHDVPFQEEENIGVNWTYTLERMPSARFDNEHIVRVTSRARIPQEDIEVKFFTNAETHQVNNVGATSPLKLFAEVKLCGVQVINAKVSVKLTALDLKGKVGPEVQVNLLDNGNGDPDLKRDDGIYSRYLTDFSAGEGRYSVTLIVEGDGSKTKTFQWAQDAGARGCCKDLSSGHAQVRDQILPRFRRIVTGDSFRVPSILSDAAAYMPPARVLDLHVEVHTSKQQLEFSWTAPGEDFDSGKVTSYLLQSSNDPAAFYTNEAASTERLDGFSATKVAGERETYRITISQYNEIRYYALIAVDKQGNKGDVSNVKQAYMPLPAATGNEALGATGSPYSQDPIPATRPERALLYIIPAIVGFLVVCGAVVVIIVVSFRRRKNMSASQTDLSSTVVGVTAATAPASSSSVSGAPQPVANSTMPSSIVASPGFHVCDEHETNRFLNSYSQNSHVSFADENPYANGSSMNTSNSATYGWTELNNPYVTSPKTSTLPGYRDFSNGNMSSLLAGYPQHQQQHQQQQQAQQQPMYAKPIPRSQRSAQMTSTLLQSPSCSSGSAQATASSAPSSSDEGGVPSISPPLPEQTRLISSASNTPTKSILKKPKNNISTLQQQQQQQQLNLRLQPHQAEDQSSQSSSGKDPERCSESSNVSFSDDRESPVTTLKKADPEYSPSNTYLETSFEVGQQATLTSKASASGHPPPTLPKPKLASVSESDTAAMSTMDRKIRNITQV